MKHAYLAISRATTRQPYDFDEMVSRSSRHSRRTASCQTSTPSKAAKIKALPEATAAKKQAEYERWQRKRMIEDNAKQRRNNAISSSVHRTIMTWQFSPLVRWKLWPKPKSQFGKKRHGLTFQRAVNQQTQGNEFKRGCKHRASSEIPLHHIVMHPLGDDETQQDRWCLCWYDWRSPITFDKSCWLEPWQGKPQSWGAHILHSGWRSHH